MHAALYCSYVQHMLVIRWNELSECQVQILSIGRLEPSCSYSVVYESHTYRGRQLRVEENTVCRNYLKSQIAYEWNEWLYGAILFKVLTLRTECWIITEHTAKWGQRTQRLWAKQDGWCWCWVTCLLPVGPWCSHKATGRSFSLCQKLCIYTNNSYHPFVDCRSLDLWPTGTWAYIEQCDWTGSWIQAALSKKANLSCEIFRLITVDS